VSGGKSKIEESLERAKGLVKKADLGANEVTDPLGPACAHFFAMGYEPDKIAELLLLNIEYVKILLEAETLKNLIDDIRRDIFGENAKGEFKALSTKAAKVVKELMASPTERGATRLQAAMYALDRAHGKPTQSMEVGGSMIKEFIQLLDAQKRGAAIDISPKTPQTVEEGELASLPELPDVAEVDAWFEKGDLSK
jgi:hypothetical protein